MEVTKIGMYRIDLTQDEAKKLLTFLSDLNHDDTPVEDFSTDLVDALEDAMGDA